MAAPITAPPGWDFLLSSEGLALLDETCASLSNGESTDRIGARLRGDGHAPDRVAATLTQAGLRHKGRAKLGPLADRLLFTPSGLEQATRHRVARAHAERFRNAGCRRVIDLGSGIGTESIALIAAGVMPVAVEVDPFTARIAEHNLGVAAQVHDADAMPTVITADAEHVDLGDADGAFLDPARRTRGHSDTRRLPSPDDYSPSLTFAARVAAALPTGVKLGPGTDRSLIPDHAEAQWVSVDGQVVEMGLWFGRVARPHVRRAALVLHGDAVDEMTSPHDSLDAPVRPLGAYLFEPDGAVIRARLIGALATELGAGHVSDGIAYLTGDDPVITPFAAAFRIIEELPPKEKALRRALATRDIGRLEIKKRGADIDPAALRARLKLRGDRSATLVMTRSEGRHVALLVERVDQRT